MIDDGRQRTMMGIGGGWWVMMAIEGATDDGGRRQGMAREVKKTTKLSLQRQLHLVKGQEDENRNRLTSSPILLFLD